MHGGILSSRTGKTIGSARRGLPPKSLDLTNDDHHSKENRLGKRHG
jgi:hypothetical protein